MKKSCEQWDKLSHNAHQQYNERKDEFCNTLGVVKSTDLVMGSLNGTPIGSNFMQMYGNFE